ncbi:MAG: 30S ribosomal protein S14 [Candidatus Peribacteria bacterium]|nr:MAG: 30S ribosomal protein S14 [Candidatus Peribacteria bacterium]
MARKALIVKQEKLAKQRQRYYELVQQCKAEGKPVPVIKGYQPTKFYNRCRTSGKTRGYMRDFGISRQAFRRYAREGIVM